MAQRRRHTAEFKAGVVKDVMREVDTLSAVAARHGVASQPGARLAPAGGGEHGGRLPPRQGQGRGRRLGGAQGGHAKIGELTLEKDFFCRVLGR